VPEVGMGHAITVPVPKTMSTARGTSQGVLDTDCLSTSDRNAAELP
jgi:hypothetical protein